MLIDFMFVLKWVKSVKGSLWLKKVVNIFVRQMDDKPSCFMTLHKFVGDKIKTVEKNCKNFETKNTSTVGSRKAEKSSNKSTGTEARFEPRSPQPFPKGLLQHLIADY